MNITSNVTSNSPDNSEDALIVGNSPSLFERRKALKIITSTIVMVVAEVSGAQGALDESYRFDQLSDLQEVVNNAYRLKESGSDSFDVRKSYGLIRSAFGGTIGRTSDYYGVSRKTIYQWLNSETAPSLQKRQAERAKLLESAAGYVRSKLGDKSKEYVKIKISGSSLDDILASESIDTARLRMWVNGIEEQIESQPEVKISLADKLEKKGHSIRTGDDDFEPLI